MYRITGQRSRLGEREHAKRYLRVDFGEDGVTAYVKPHDGIVEYRFEGDRASEDAWDFAEDYDGWLLRLEPRPGEEHARFLVTLPYGEHGEVPAEYQKGVKVNDAQRRP